MCQVGEKADGAPDAPTQKMQGTGRSWAGRDSAEAYHDNAPVTGFVIGDSVSRWTTDNKLFRVVDPRGFEVEVPTGNIAALLKYCTVVQGVVTEECVWGREGGSHLLLPVNSEPYIEATKVITKIATATLKANDLKLGDRVRLLRSGEIDASPMEFFGLVKLTWLRKRSTNRYRYAGGGWGWSRPTELISSTPLPSETVNDDRWVAVFGRQGTTYDYSKPHGYQRDATARQIWVFSYELSPKIVERTPGEPSTVLTPELANEKGYVRAPDRVLKRFSHYPHASSYDECRIESEDSIIKITHQAGKGVKKVD